MKNLISARVELDLVIKCVRNSTRYVALLHNEQGLVTKLYGSTDLRTFVLLRRKISRCQRKVDYHPGTLVDQKSI